MRTLLLLASVLFIVPLFLASPSPADEPPGPLALDFDPDASYQFDGPVGQRIDVNVKNWLLRHKRFHLHFTPTYSSWMNLVERWFSALTTKKLQRGVHDSVAELAADIEAWIELWNTEPNPFIWTKTADQILDKLARYCTTITTTE